MSASIWTPGTVISTVENPLTPIQFLKGTAALPGITFAGDVNTGVWSEADGYINFTVNGTTVIQIDSLGNLTTHANKWVSANELDVASATTVDLGASTSNIVRITGTNNITSFGTTYKGPIFIRFAGVLVLSSTATLILPSGLSIQTAAGDSCVVVPKSTAGVPDGWQVISYTKASGGSIVASADATSTLRIDVASAGTIDLTATGPAETRNINITGTTTINGFTIPAGGIYFVRFNGACTLTNSASLVTQTGGNRLTAAGDSCILRATGANVVELICYSPGIPATPVAGAQVFTASGSWVCPAGIYFAKFTVTGGGAGSPTNSSRTPIAAAGGGTAIRFKGAVVPGTTYTVTIGAGGIAGTGANGNGNGGGTTSVTGSGFTTISATGGGGSLSGETFSAGGVGTGGDLNLTGGATSIASVGAVPIPGLGGGSYWGPQGRYGVTGTSPGVGAGGVALGDTTGAAGAAGLVVIEY